MTASEDGAKVQCHACGRWFGALNTHIKTHGLDGDAYKEAFGLPRTASMLPPSTQERYRAATIARDQGNRFRDALPAPQGRPKGIANRLGASIRASQQRKGRYRGKPIDEG
ncbi:MAG: MucR family transcriptional regulator [Rhodospirillaceae bacterium]|nr:MucR family transcriptional regulator [Rhodospirillaceae bacterium]